MAMTDEEIDRLKKAGLLTRESFRQAAAQPSFAGRTGATLRAIGTAPVKYARAMAGGIGEQVGDMRQEFSKEVVDPVSRFGRALVTGSESIAPATETQTSATVVRTPPASNAENFVERKGDRADMFPVTPQAFKQQGSAAIPTRNVITNSQGNRTFIDETGKPRTISASGQDVTGQRRQPLPRDADSSAAASAPSAYSQRVRIPQQGPFSPDYSNSPAAPARLADSVNPNATFGEFVTTGRRQLRAATADQQADLKREDMTQWASSEGMDRLLRAADLAQRGQISVADREQRAQSELVDQNLRRQQLEQTGAYQQGELGLRKEDLTAKTTEAGAERSAEAARQERLNAALNIYDDPKAPPEAKQRARRIIEANQGKASFDLGEKPMTQADAQKSLQDTWRAVAGNDAPHDPTSAEQLQGVAQANPAAWKAVYGNASPAQVQKYNLLSRLPDADIAKDPAIAAEIKKNGGGQSPEEARIILEELIRKQRGF